MTYLVDVNVWLALAVEGHVHHAVAKEWFSGLASGEARWCSLSELSFLRLSTNRAALGRSVVTPRAAWELLQTLLSDERVREVREPDGLLPKMRDFTAPAREMSGSSWTDAYLAAFAAACGYTLATFDKRIGKRYPLRVEAIA